MLVTENRISPPLLEMEGIAKSFPGKRAIREGKIYADPVHFPERIGRETVRTIVKYLRGDEVRKEILIPTALYRKADAQRDPAAR